MTSPKDITKRIQNYVSKHRIDDDLDDNEFIIEQEEDNNDLLDQRYMNEEFKELTNRINYEIQQLDVKIAQAQELLEDLEYSRNNLKRIMSTQNAPKGIYAAYNNIIESIAKLFLVIKEYEQVKHNYFKVLRDIVYDKRRLSIEMVRIEHKLENIDLSLIDLQKVLSSLDGQVNQLIQNDGEPPPPEITESSVPVSNEEKDKVVSIKDPRCSL